MKSEESKRNELLLMKILDREIRQRDIKKFTNMPVAKFILADE
jgi:hypothetical protein